MNRLEHQIERDLRQIADRATPSPDAWNSILTRIADQDPDTETEIIMLTEATPHSTRRWPLFASAAAVVLAIIGATVIAFAVNNSSSDDDQTPSPAAATTVAPTTVAPTTTTVAPRTETVSFGVESANDIPVTFTVPVDWAVEEGWSAFDESAGVIFDEIGNIYADGCQWVLVDPPVGPTVDDLVAAWANLSDFAATAAVDVTVDGYAGKQIEFTVPDYNSAECRGNQFGLYRYDRPGPGDSPDHFGSPNDHLQMWVLDVDGTRLVIAATTLPSTSPQDRAALDEVLASIQIG